MVFGCDGSLSMLVSDDSLLSTPSIEDELSIEKVMGTADERQIRKARKITMQR